MSKRSDTIAAICTPCGRSGIGIIRISGYKSLDIISRITLTRNGHQNSFLDNHRKLIHAYLLDSDKIKIDEILYAVMPPGRSYTGELTVEINCHGGIDLLNTALDLVIENGARLAYPGEFTRRAVDNGRMDIVQAEALNDLIMAKTKVERKIAWRQFEGGLSGVFKEIKEKLIDMISHNSYIIDFEDEKKENDFENIEFSLNKIKEKIYGLLVLSNNTRILRQGYWVVLSGPPNSGKSTIFNAILNTNRSIVSDMPGTTRDYIIESMIINGIELKLIDTAGIRDTSDDIERISIEKSKLQIDKADLIIFILDKSKKISDEEKKQANIVINDGGFVIFNKSDLEANIESKKFYEQNSEGNVFSFSAINGSHINEIIEKIKERLSEKNIFTENQMVTSERQKKLLQEAYESLDKTLKLEKQGKKDLVNYELRYAVKKIDEIFCVDSDEEIINNIFEKFCVGK